MVFLFLLNYKALINLSLAQDYFMGLKGLENIPALVIHYLLLRLIQF